MSALAPPFQQNTMKDWDLTTLGSTMLSLSTGAGIPFPGSDGVRVDIAGAESNCAIALASLGKRVAWQSKVAKTPLGERIVSKIRAREVDVSKVIWAAEGRNELMFVESGLGANRTNVIYDRAGASIESLSMDEVDFATIESSRIFHFSGITPALSERCRETVAEVVQRARQAGVKVSCDVNYRSKLWSAEEAREEISKLIGDLDLLLVGQEDLKALWKRSGDPEDELRRLQDEFRIADVVMTKGPGGAIGLLGGSIYEQEAFASEVVSPIGAGDAFAAGVLYSLLNEEPALSLKRGCAMAALARESRSDYVLSGIEALEEKMSSGGDSGKRLSR